MSSLINRCEEQKEEIRELKEQLSQYKDKEAAKNIELSLADTSIVRTPIHVPAIRTLKPKKIRDQEAYNRAMGMLRE